MEKKSATNVFAKECIAMALRQLMQQRPYEQITISDIVRKAGVSRMAYYRNYQSKEDIILKTLEEHARITDRYTIPLFESRNLEGYITYLFEDFARVSDFYASLLKANLGDIILHYFNRCTIQFVSRYHNPEPRKHVILAFSGAIYNMAITWILEGMKETPAEMAQIYLSTVNSAQLFSLLEPYM